MKLSKFNYKLPYELIAQHPVQNRDESRLLVLHKNTGKIEHTFFKDIINYFDEHDVFVLTDKKVFPSCLYGNNEKNVARIKDFS